MSLRRRGKVPLLDQTRVLLTVDSDSVEGKLPANNDIYPVRYQQSARTVGA